MEGSRKMDKKELEQAVRRNLDWFRHSKVMDPPDGSWGVAERLAVTQGNSALEKIFTVFPAWSEFDGYCVIEPRRPDCNFETALLFLLAGEHFDCTEYREVGGNLLHYLFRRSGMLFSESGTWNWSSITRYPTRWYDDNGWCGALQLLIARLRPDLDREYRLSFWGSMLAERLADGVDRAIDSSRPIEHGVWPDPEGYWQGEPRLPHWGAVAVFAGSACRGSGFREKFNRVIRRYYEYLFRRRDTLIASELAYALLGAAWVAGWNDDGFYRELVEAFSSRMLERMDPATGNLPAEHCEAPRGPHLVDTIYTANWALLGMQAAATLTGNPEQHAAADRLAGLMLRIQDASGVPAYDGCWRGMFDLEAGTWGGGDCYEGGQNSIYSGWTNAPIALALLLRAGERSLIQL